MKKLYYYPYPKCTRCDYYNKDAAGGEEPCPWWEDDCELIGPDEAKCEDCPDCFKMDDPKYPCSGDYYFRNFDPAAEGE